MSAAIWENKKLSEITDVRDGTHDSPKPSPIGFPLVTSKHITSNKIDLSNTYLISKVDFESVNKRSKVDQYDLLLSMIGTVGEVVLVKEKPNFAIKNVGLIKTGDEILGKYLYYYLVSPSGKNSISKLLSGSTQKFISLGQLRNLSIKIPRKDCQKEIVSVLSKYDDLIENNEKRIKILEEMAQRLYADWFVKFKFPGYEKVKMVDSGTEFGLIPEGWRIKKLGDFINVIGGLSYKNEFLTNDENCASLITMGSVHPQHPFNENHKQYYKGPFKETNVVRCGDLVIATRDVTSERNILGSPVLIGKNIDYAIVATNMYKIINSSFLPSTYLYLLFRSQRFRKRMIGYAHGTNILMIVKDDVLKYKFICPTKELIDFLNPYLNNILHEIETLMLANMKTKQIRDLLIPQLVTGKRELKNEERN